MVTLELDVSPGDVADARSALAAALADRCASYVAAGRTEVEYEEAIRDLILAEPARFAAADVTALPWVEIDFPEDVRRARDEILPQLTPA